MLWMIYDTREGRHDASVFCVVAAMLLALSGFSASAEASTAPQPSIAPAGSGSSDANVSVEGTGLVPGDAASVAAPLDDPATAHPAVAPASAQLPASSGVTPADYYCEFLARYDDVHHPAGSNYVSGHGWWNNVDCPAGTKAKVKTWIQEYYSDGSWRTKNTGTKTVYSGGGSANRSNARHTCDKYVTVSCRSEVDVDLVGISDSNNIGRSATQTFACLVN